jgi:hypothetical protein
MPRTRACWTLRRGQREELAIVQRCGRPGFRTPTSCSRYGAGGGRVDVLGRWQVGGKRRHRISRSYLPPFRRTSKKMKTGAMGPTPATTARAGRLCLRLLVCGSSPAGRAGSRAEWRRPRPGRQMAASRRPELSSSSGRRCRVVPGRRTKQLTGLRSAVRIRCRPWRGGVLCPGGSPRRNRWRRSSSSHTEAPGVDRVSGTGCRSSTAGRRICGAPEVGATSGAT